MKPVTESTLVGTRDGIAIPSTDHDFSLGQLIRRWLRATGRYLGAVPFFGYVAIFLLWPTYLVVSGALESGNGRFTLSTLRDIVKTPAFVDSFKGSLEISAGTAVAGAVLGGLLAWALWAGNPSGVFRRAVTAMSGVLAQFGGVMLAFAFLATYGYNGLVTLVLQDALKVNTFAIGGWIYSLFGLGVVYTFFQIPLMVLIFLPALDGLQPEWRAASDNLGGGSWAYWRFVAGPVLVPSFLGTLLLLFVNSFSAYATAAALITQGAPIVPLQIATFMQSEIVLGQANVGKALALAMVVIVVVVMSLYALVQGRTAKWRRR